MRAIAALQIFAEDAEAAAAKHRERAATPQRIRKAADAVARLGDGRTVG